MRSYFLLTLLLLSGWAFAQPRASFDSIWVDYDIEENGQRGMRIHLSFTTYGMKEMDAYAAIYFEFNDELAGYLKDKNNRFTSTEGDVAVYRSLKPAYDPAVYRDLDVFMPYAELDLEPGIYDLTMDVKLIYKAGGVISRLTSHDFEYAKPGSPADRESESDASVTFEGLRVDYDVTENGKKGMRIHVSFNVDNMKDVDAYLAIYFEYRNGDPIEGKNTGYRSKSGQLALYKSVRPAYVQTVYKDLQLFMPYSEMNVPKGKHDLRMDVSLILEKGDLVKHLNNYDFWFEH